MKRLFFISLSMIALGVCFVVGCGDPTNPLAGFPEQVDRYDALDQTGGDVRFDEETHRSAPECIDIDRLKQTVLPPTSIRITFRVTTCDGFPVSGLSANDITLINDESGVPFGWAESSGSASEPQVPPELRQFTVLVLDLSDSVVNDGRLADIVDSATVFVEHVLEHPSTALHHEVAILGFGGTDEVVSLHNFTAMLQRCTRCSRR